MGLSWSADTPAEPTITITPATIVAHRFAMTSPPRLGRRELEAKTWMAPFAA
jgi:hypothetical protein